MRKATHSRKTAETAIEVKLNLDGTGQYDNRTGVGFFDHMLDQLARHSLIDLTIETSFCPRVDCPLVVFFFRVCFRFIVSLVFFS